MAAPESILVLLGREHGRIRELFATLSESPEPVGHLRSLYDELRRRIAGHSLKEEEVFYPELRRLEATTRYVPASLAEHVTADRLLVRLDGMEPGSPRWRHLFAELRERILSHLAFEEQVVFPALARALSPERLARLGQRLQRLSDWQGGDEFGPGRAA